MDAPFLGEIRLVAFEFAPPGWARCEGQLLPISENDALFALLGTTYGGDGRTTFALPDLRGRVALHSGQGAGLSPRAPGERGGVEQVTLAVGQLAAHTHARSASGAQGTTDSPAGAAPAGGGEYGAPDGTKLAPTGKSGAGRPHDNMPPFLALSYIIALEGIFPSRG